MLWANFSPNTIDYGLWPNLYPHTIDYGSWANFYPNTIDYGFCLVSAVILYTMDFGLICIRTAKRRQVF